MFLISLATVDALAIAFTVFYHPVMVWLTGNEKP
jgi:hypothetical protein